MSADTPRGYPRRIDCAGSPVEIARMAAGDRDALVAFVATLAPHDLLFLPRDIGHPKDVDAWMRALDSGELTSLVARDGDAMVGCTAIFTDELSWSRHVGELRVLVAPAWRGKGLGRVLIQECFAQALELGLKKLVAQMTTDQRAAIAVFEELGFRAEALLARHVADRSGTLHDLVLLSHDVAVVEARNDALGLTDALGR
jgi:L-amino acid N-acyltransferase YncA